MKPKYYDKPKHVEVVRFKQGVVEARCKGCFSEYCGYCLSVPFDKPSPCERERK